MNKFFCTLLFNIAFFGSHAQFIPDSSFHFDGHLKSNINIEGAGYLKVNQQRDGKIIVAQKKLLRFLNDGTVDSSFAVNGVVDSLPLFATDMLIQTDDKIVLGGHIKIKGRKDFALCRYNSNGSLDLSFGLNGIVQDSSYGMAGSEITSLALQNNGKIIAGGIQFNHTILNPSALKRYNPNGATDTTFKFNHSLNILYIRKISVVSNGQLLLYGAAVTGGGGPPPFYILKIAFLKLKSNGTADSTYGTNGLAITAHSPQELNNPLKLDIAVAVQADGKVVRGFMAFNSSWNLGSRLYRFLPNGLLDSTFGTSGTLFIKSLVVDHIHHVKNQGYLLSANMDTFLRSTGNLGYALVNLDTNGNLIKTCNSGISYYDTNGYSAVRAMHLQKDGRVIVAGSNNTDFYMARFHQADDVRSYSVESCDQYLFKTMLLTKSGTYLDTMTGRPGCDSIIYLNLTIKSVDVSTSQVGAWLGANSNIANSYQWIDCSSGNPIPGAKNQTYTATQNGSYAVIVTQNGCTDTSECLTVTGVGIRTLSSDDISIYPNPNNGKFIIDGIPISPTTLVSIINPQGQMVFESQVNNKERFQVELNAANGLYYIQIKGEGILLTKKIILQ